MAKFFGFVQVSVEKVILWEEIQGKLNGLGRRKIGNFIFKDKI